MLIFKLKTYMNNLYKSVVLQICHYLNSTPKIHTQYLYSRKRKYPIKSNLTHLLKTVGYILLGLTSN